MKTLVALLCVLFATATLTAQTPPAKAGAKKGAPAKQEAAKEEEPKIEGIELKRADGTFLGLSLSEGKFKLAFYDLEKKPMQVNVLRAVARWPNVHGPGQNRTVLNRAGDGTYLQGAQFVRGPYSFTLFVTLIKNEEGTDAETFTVPFRG